MSSFATKYRPGSFEEMRGNKEVVSSLKSMVESKTPPRAYLLTGISGVGKTTAARICHAVVGGIKIEMNIADKRGIDGVRDIAADYQFGSIGNKVYILDEVHQMTPEAQSVMLKVLEDIPEHCYFFLCTTRPEKIISAVRTRCMELEFQPVNSDTVLELLLDIMEEEEIVVPVEVVKSIAEKQCQGSPRLAVNLLEKCRSVNSLEEAEKFFPQDLGLADNGDGDFEVAKLLRDVLCRDNFTPSAHWRSLSKVLEERVLCRGGANPLEVKRGLMALLGKSCQRTYSPRLANAIVCLHGSESMYGNAAFVATMTKVAQACDVSKKEE